MEGPLQGGGRQLGPGSVSAAGHGPYQMETVAAQLQPVGTMTKLPMLPMEAELDGDVKHPDFHI